MEQTRAQKRAAQREASRERMRAYRERRRRGVFGLITVRIHDEDVAALISAGLLPNANEFSPEEVGETVERVLAAWRSGLGRRAGDERARRQI